MAVTYLRLFPATQQFELRNGQLNVAGRLNVFFEGTDDLADLYDENGTQLAQPVILDDNGRARGLFVDSKKVYRLEVYDQFGELLYTVRKMVPSGGGTGSALGKVYEVVSNDGSILVDKFDEGGTTTFDLSLGIDANELKPSCLRASAAPVTTDGQFVFDELVREGNLLSVDQSGKVRMEPAWYHFTAIVELSYDGTPVNEAHQVTLWTTLSNSVIGLDTSYAHRESIELSGDIHVVGNNTEFPLGVSGLDTGITASLMSFDIHAVTGHEGNNEYHAGEGITIVNATKTISADFDSVQEKLVAGENISITGNVISAGNFSQEQADWTEDDTTSPAYIQNKPDLDVYATKAEVTTGLATKQDTIPDLAAIRSGAQAGASAVQPADLAAVATTGDYNSLNNRPNLTVYATKTEVNTGLAAKQDVISDLSAIRSGAQLGSTSVQPANLNSYATDAELTAGLSTKQDTINDLSTIRSGAAAGATALQPSDVAAVAVSGNYADLINKPTIPTKTSDLTNDSGFITASGAPVQDVQVDGTSVVNAQGIAEITMPTTGVLDVEVDGTSVVNAQGTAEIDLSGYATTQALTTGLAAKQDTISDLATIRSGAAAGATAVQPGDLATVATTGDYDDLTDKPDLSVYATGAELTAGLATKQDTISDLATIRSGAADGSTAVQPGDLATVATTGAYSDLSGTPSIPTKTSDLTNDSGFITLADVPAQVQSDWTESDSTDPSYIANKPNLAAVATSGDYADLSGTPTINNVPTVTSSDDAKVLKASYTGGVGSYSWDSLPANSAVFTVGVDSYEDIVSAYNDGKICFAQTSGSDYLYPLTRAHVDGTYSTFNFWLDFTPATTYDTNQGIAERTRYTVTSSGWTTTKEKVAPYILAASRIATDLNTDTKVLSVSADIPVITSGNDKVIDIADTGRIEVASSAFSGTATKTDTFTRDGYSFYTSDGSRLIGNKWTPFTPYMSGSYTVSFSGGDASRNLTFTSAGAYTWDDNTLADPSTFPANGTIHYGLFQGKLDANNRMTLNPTLIGNLISDVANVTSSDSSVSATVNRPENVSMTINVVAGKKLLTAFYVQFSGVTYFLSTTQNPFNKPSILISQQIGNIAKVVEEAPVDTKSYVRKDGAWVEESGGGGGSYTAGTGIDITNNVVSVDNTVAMKSDLPAAYTAGDGISIANNEISAKAGTGLEIADVSETTTDNLVCAAMSSIYDSGNWAQDICPMTQALADAMNTSAGYAFTLVKPFDTYNVYAWPAIAKTSELLQGELQNYAYFGNYLSCRPSTDGSDRTYEVPAGTTLTLKFSERDQFSTITVADILADLSSYSLVILWFDEGSPYAAETMLSSSMTPETTATHTTTTTLQDALCVKNPLPASTVSDADKVLKVNSSGAPEWATGGGDDGADWDAEQGEPGYIENKPVPKTLTAGAGISISENASTITISSSVTAPVRDVTVDGTSVVSNGVAAITTPTVDQTYDASSTNAQSGVAVASGIAAAIAAAVIPISVVSTLPANPDPNTLYVVTGA